MDQVPSQISERPESTMSRRGRDPGQPLVVSVIVPCHNEEEVIETTHRRLSETLSKAADGHEIIYIDDGSKDRTSEILRGIQETDPAVRLLTLSRNFGHQVAVTAGLDRVSGQVVVVIDADLQDPPEVIEEMLGKWREGYDVVYGQRVEREGETVFKLLSARYFYRLIGKLSDVPIPADTGDFRLMDRRVVEALTGMRETDRFLRGMISWVGFRQVALPYRRHKRFAGKSKYPLLKMIRFATDGILSFSTVPLSMAIWLGVGAAGLAVVGVFYALFVRLLTTEWVSGWALLFIAVLFIGGVQLFVMGVIGEYIGRIYREAKDRPLYLVDEALGFDRVSEKAAGSPTQRQDK